MELKLANLERFLEQARYDPSVSPQLLGSWRDFLLGRLDVQSLKYQYASLYGGLVTEWLSAANVSDDDDKMSEDFEEVSSRQKLESRAEWEKSVFEPLETDQAAIEAYLNELFGEKGDDKQVHRARKQLRDSVDAFEIQLAKPEPFDSYVLSWVIKGLQASDLLTDEKRTVLKDFNNNPVILSELADVLNMRMAALESWTWGGDVPLEDRRRLNGSNSIYMQEDLLQAIFLQYIGVKWSVFFKGAFTSFYRSEGAWTPTRKDITKLDKKRREYYLGSKSAVYGLNLKRQKLYKTGYFVTQLLNSETQDIVIDDGDEEAKYEPPAKRMRGGRTTQTARASTGGKAPRKQLASRAAPQDDIDMSDEDDMQFGIASYLEDEDDDKPKNPMELKQSLLHLLSTEILVNTRLHGELTCVRAEFDNWNPSLPHSTIFAVLAFFGVSDKWLRFFRIFLEAPLKFVDSGEEARMRKRGVPGSHTLSDVLGEVVLFCLDFSVNQGTQGMQLHRMHDDLWFWSRDHQACVSAWSAVTKFTDVMGVSINHEKAGTVRTTRGQDKAELDIHLPKGQIRWGFLYLDSGSGRFKIDHTMVDEHIEELQRQLEGKTRSIFLWVQAWNTYAATFFKTNFGKPANCFGLEHVDMMLSTLERVQRTIFEADGTGSVVEFLRAKLHERFGLTDIPDGYFYFPTELGGLELRSPFVGLLQIVDAVPTDPSLLLDDFMEAELEAYRKAKIAYDNGATRRKVRDDPKFEPEDPDTFMSFEEYSRYREDINGELSSVFEQLMRRPEEESVQCTSEVEEGIQAIGAAGGNGQEAVVGPWNTMDNYWKWVVEMYGPEVMKKFGGLNIVDKGLLPLGMIGLFRSGRAKWSE